MKPRAGFPFSSQCGTTLAAARPAAAEVPRGPLRLLAADSVVDPAMRLVVDREVHGRVDVSGTGRGRPYSI